MNKLNQAYNAYMQKAREARIAAYGHDPLEGHTDAIHYLSARMSDKCFACDKQLTTNYFVADTRDGQVVHVGNDCYRKIMAAGEAGFQPDKGGPRLWPFSKPQPSPKARGKR